MVTPCFVAHFIRCPAGDAYIAERELFADVFRSVVDPYDARLAAPFDDAVKTSDHPFGGQREVDFDAKSFAVEVVENIQQSKGPAVTQSIRHEVPLRRLLRKSLPGSAWTRSRSAHLAPPAHRACPASAAFGA